MSVLPLSLSAFLYFPSDQGTGSFIDILRPFALNSEGTLRSGCSSDIKVLGSIPV